LGSIENCLEPKTKPPLDNLACPILWNALYMYLYLYWNILIGYFIQGILSVLGIAGYKWVPARIGSFYKDKIFFFIIPTANKKQEKQILIRQLTIPLFSIPCFIWLDCILGAPDFGVPPIDLDPNQLEDSPSHIIVSRGPNRTKQPSSNKPVYFLDHYNYLVHRCLPLSIYTPSFVLIWSLFIKYNYTLNKKYMIGFSFSIWSKNIDTLL